MFDLKTKDNAFTFENERAICFTKVTDKNGNKATKKMTVIDKKMDVSFSVIIPLEHLENGDIHHYPSKQFTVLGDDTDENNTMAKYYGSLNAWESFKDEFFNEYSSIVNKLIFK